MLSNVRRFLRQRQGLKSFKAIPRMNRRCVIYSEGGGYWTYFEPIIRVLIDEYSEGVIYITSSETDEVLSSAPRGVMPIYLGAGAIRTIFFATLDADVLVMTMPDLETFHIKRSPYPVKYVYLHHSMVSTHMVYRPAAFDHFDAILCVGPHHVEEIKVRERNMGLLPKELIEHGYGRLDTMLKESISGPRLRAKESLKCVLVAPTWGDNSLLESRGCEVVRHLIDAGIKVIVRPHPRTVHMRPDIIGELMKDFSSHQLFQLDTDANALKSFYAADVMVSDWSGAALEFSFGLERPVIFIDSERKIQNPKFDHLDIEPLEVKIREKIGKVLPLDQLHKIGHVSHQCVDDAWNWQLAAQLARNQWVFNIGHSSKVAASYLKSILP